MALGVHIAAVSWRFLMSGLGCHSELNVFEVGPAGVAKLSLGGVVEKVVWKAVAVRGVTRGVPSEQALRSCAQEKRDLQERKSCWERAGGPRHW